MATRDEGGTDRHDPAPSTSAAVERAHAASRRHFRALALVLERAEIAKDDLDAALFVLRRLALVDLKDLCVPPGFNLLPDGEVGSANSETAEWKFWATAQELVDNANQLEIALFRATMTLRDSGIGGV